MSCFLDHVFIGMAGGGKLKALKTFLVIPAGSVDIIPWIGIQGTVCTLAFLYSNPYATFKYTDIEGER